MKDASRPPGGRQPFQSEPDPKRDTPFDLYRYRVQTMPQGLRRELIGIKLPLLDPKDLNDTNPPNGGLSAPDVPETRPRRAERTRAVLAVGLVALVTVGAAVVWPMVSSPKPARSAATTAQAAPNHETAPKPRAQPVAKDREPVPEAPVESSTLMPTTKAPLAAASAQRVTAENGGRPTLTPSQQEQPHAQPQRNSGSSPKQLESTVATQPPVLEGSSVESAPTQKSPTRPSPGGLNLREPLVSD